MENKKITLQELADVISAHSGATKRFTDSFLRELVVVIQEYLEKDGIVKVKSLGTFKLLWIEARKSVNVATKETIVLPAHYKLSFTPEENVKQEINAHVSSFGGAEVLETSLNVAESIEEERDNKESSEIIISEEVKEENIPSDEDTSTHEISSAQEVISTQAETPTQVEPPTVSEVVDTQKENKSNKTLISIIVILIIVILGLCVYIFYPQIEKGLMSIIRPTMQESNFEVVATPDSINLPSEAPIQDSVKLEVEEEIKEPVKEEIKEEPIITVDNYTSDVAKNAPTREVVTVIDGSRLTMVAYRAYGHKAFWVYVFDANRDRLKRPSDVEKGMELRIPDLPKSLVNSKDQRCLDKAYELAKQYDK